MNLGDFLDTLSSSNSAFREDVKWLWTLNSSLLAGPGVSGFWKVFYGHCPFIVEFLKGCSFTQCTYFLVAEVGN